MTKRKIDSASYDLNSIYYSIMAQNPYLQADYDGFIRRTCRGAGVGQRNGMSLEALQQKIDLVEGIAPQTRYEIKQIAEACWTLSKYGVLTEPLRLSQCTDWINFQTGNEPRSGGG